MPGAYYWLVYSKNQTLNKALAISQIYYQRKYFYVLCNKTMDIREYKSMNFGGEMHGKCTFKKFLYFLKKRQYTYIQHIAMILGFFLAENNLFFWSVAKLFFKTLSEMVYI